MCQDRPRWRSESGNPAACLCPLIDGRSTITWIKLIYKGIARTLDTFWYCVATFFDRYTYIFSLHFYILIYMYI